MNAFIQQFLLTGLVRIRLAFKIKAEPNHNRQKYFEIALIGCLFWYPAKSNGMSDSTEDQEKI